MPAQGNALGNRPQNRSRAEGPAHHADRQIIPAFRPRWGAPSALRDFLPRYLGRCPRLAWAGPLALRHPLPPLAEQRRIVAKVEQLMALVDALETQLAASRATAANLLTALVAELTTASANGAAPSQPGATPQVKGRKHNEG